MLAGFARSHAGAWRLCMGVLIIIPIGGADMPVVVSMLNGYSGWAAAGIGFSLNNAMLIIAGSLVGYVRRDPELHHVQGHEPLVLQRDPGRLRRRGRRSGGGAQAAQRPVKSGSADDAAFVLGNAETVVIVPGYGLAAGTRPALPSKELGGQAHREGHHRSSTPSTRWPGACRAT
jgi:NAD(P) transhydrogenase subunit beta